MKLASASSLVVLALVAGTSQGCAHDVQRERGVDDGRRLFVLEREFAAFTGTRLDLDEDGRPLSPDAAREKVDDAIAELERLRLSYLDLVGERTAPAVRVTALVRMGELHLDLGARVRRLPYPVDADRAAKVAFDRELSRLALPLEATGIGVLEQAQDVARRTGIDTRLSRRAALYLALHRDRARLDEVAVKELQRELAGATAYPAPRRLLEVGRVGQRAARVAR